MFWDVFCRVIDNHGDLGVCWRLSVDLASRQHRVRLWVDDPTALAWMAPALFEQLSPIGQRIGPSVAYVVLAAMVATSFDRSAAWLGPRWWARLHTWGSHYLCLSFLVANGKRVAQQPVYALPVLLLILAVLWRLWAARQRRTPGVSASAQG